MKLKIINLLLPVICCLACNSTSEAQKEKEKSKAQKVKLINQKAEQKVDVLVGGKLLTSYCYSDSLMKPILYPILTSSGTPVTRGWPINPREGERTDHPHHRGMWLNYGDVNGYDFWGNSYEIPAAVRAVHDGRIKHLKIEQLTSGTGEGTLITEESWRSPFDHKIIAERTTYHFIADGPTRIIDRITTLTADTSKVAFKDTKEGMFGIRVARQLEIPSKKSITLTDAQGNPTNVKVMHQENATGNYRSSEGITGDSVWATRARWMDLFGNIGDEKISLVICDHPENLNYPTYWHARGYGLFAANPFGVKDFTGGKDSLNYSLESGKSLTFRYRVIISSGKHLNEAEINTYAADFGKKYH